MALNFTKQQLEGGVKYGNKSLLGNWAEDAKDEEVKFSEHVHRKKNNNLLLSQRSAVLNFALQPCPLAFREKGEAIRFGDAVMLHNQACDSFLAVLPKGLEEWYVSTSPSPQGVPVARSVFHLVPIPGSDRAGEALRYGDPFCIVAEPVLSADANGIVMEQRFLTTRPKAHHEMAKLSCESPAFMASSFSQAAVWCIDSSLPGTEGWRVNVARGPVLLEDAIVVRNRMSNLVLASSPKHSLTGKLTKAKEFEAFSCPSTTKKPCPDTVWSLVTARAPEAAQDTRNLTQLDQVTATRAVKYALGSQQVLDDVMDDLRHIEANDELTREDVATVLRERLCPEFDHRFSAAFLDGFPSSEFSSCAFADQINTV